MATTTMPGGQVGRSLPRLEAREKVTGRAEYTHLMRLPGMLYAKIYRSTVAHGRIKSIDVSAAKAVPGVHRVITAEDVLKVIPEPYYGPAFHDQPILAIDKVHYIGEPVAVVLARDPHVAEEAASMIVADYEELPAVFDEVEAADNEILVHEELKPAGTFADLKHLKGRRGTNIALDFRLRRGDVDKAFAARRACVRAHVPDPKGSAPRARAILLDRRLEGERRHDLQRRAGTVVRAYRDRAAARLAGEPRPHQGAVSRRRLRRQALHQDRGARGRALDDRAPAGEGRAHDGRAVLPHHQASEHVPHQERRRQGRPHHGAQVRGVLERRRLCGYRPARDAEIRLQRRRGLTTSRTSRSIPTRSTPTCRRPARCAASASRNWSGPTRATPT